MLYARTTKLTSVRTFRVIGVRSIFVVKADPKIYGRKLTCIDLTPVPLAFSITSVKRNAGIDVSHDCYGGANREGLMAANGRVRQIPAWPLFFYRLSRSVAYRPSEVKMPACKRAADLGAVPRKPTQFHQETHSDLPGPPIPTIPPRRKRTSDPAKSLTDAGPWIHWSRSASMVAIS
jgi:hypothetical protein